MRPSAQIVSQLIISLLLTMACATGVVAQASYPKGEGEKVTLKSSIEMEKAYLSGLCILRRQGDEVRGSIFNEFGISAMDFTYRAGKDKVRLHSVVKMMDKWYIRRMLRKDLREVMHELREGRLKYENNRNKITYTFVPIERGERKDDGAR